MTSIHYLLLVFDINFINLKAIIYGFDASMQFSRPMVSHVTSNGALLRISALKLNEQAYRVLLP